MKHDQSLVNDLNLEEVLLDTLPNPVYYKDTEGKFIKCNQAFATLVNTNKKDIIGKVAYDFFPKDVADEHKCIDIKIMETLGKYDDQVIFPLKNDELKYYILSKAVYLKKSGEVGGIVCIMNDITQSIKDKNLLTQNSKFAEMGEMIASVAHQWQEPLVELSAQIQKLQIFYSMDRVDKNRMNTFVQDSMVQIKYMSETLQDFRNFLKPSTIQNTFTIKKAVDDILAIVGKQIFYFNINIKFEYEDENLEIFAYENEYKQVLLNILNNAKNKILKRNNQDGFKGSITIKTSQDTKHIITEIIDDAGKIESTVIKRVFEPFFTTKSEGTGFGLYMAKIIIEDKMSGIISVRNEEENVIFTIKVPKKEK
jgi:PAS domain S-box-containing protein